jgi:hypothetical protein
LKLQPGESFTIEKRTEPGKRQWFEVQKLQKGDKAHHQPPVTTEGRAADQSSTARLPKPLQAIQEPCPPIISTMHPPAQPANPQAAKTALPAKNQPVIQPVIAAIQPPQASGVRLVSTRPLRLDYETAFRECLRIVQEALKSSGEQWSDEARQAAVSTLFIAAQRENAVSFRTGALGAERIA